MSAVMEEELPVWLKALAGAAAGRALLLLEARRDLPLTWRRVLTAILWEMPLIAAFALLGWHVTAAAGITDESSRIVVVVLLSYLGARGIDRLLSRFIPGQREPPP